MGWNAGVTGDGLTRCTTMPAPDWMFISRMKMISMDNRKHVKSSRNKTSIDELDMDAVSPELEVNDGQLPWPERGHEVSPPGP